MRIGLLPMSCIPSQNEYSVDIEKLRSNLDSPDLFDLLENP